MYNTTNFFLPLSPSFYTTDLCIYTCTALTFPLTFFPPSPPHSTKRVYKVLLTFSLTLSSLLSLVDVLGHPFGKVPPPRPFDGCTATEAEIILSDPANPVGKNLLAGESTLLFILCPILRWDGQSDNGLTHFTMNHQCFFFHKCTQLSATVQRCTSMRAVNPAPSLTPPVSSPPSPSPLAPPIWPIV